VTARRPRLRRRVVVLVGVLGLAACRIEEVPRTGPNDPDDLAREEIDRTREAYRQALLKGDADAITGVFTRDATLAEPDAPDIVGSDAIEAAMRTLFAHATITDVLLEPDPLDVATGGIALELGRFEQTLQVPEQPAATRRGRYAIRWLRGPDEAWRIQRMLYNLYPAEPAADTSATR
jgi:uncharacterized protein (TIGR02246 family)